MTRSLLLLALLAAPAAGQTYTWTGAGNGNWSSVGNWDLAGVPANAATSNVVFNNTVGLINVVDLTPTPYNIGSLTFGTSAGTFNITPTNVNPTTLRLNGGIQVNGTVAQTISNPLALGATQSWGTTAGGGNLFVDGSVNATGQTLNVIGGGNLTISQGAVVTGGTLVQNSTGVTTLSANNTLAAVTVQQGTLVVNKVGTGSPIGTGPVTLAGGTLSFRVFGNPVSASGYNHDVVTAVSEFPGGTPYGTTRAVDGNNGAGSFVYFQAGVDAANPQNGLPANGRFTSGGVNYQFQDYTGNNVLSLGNTNSGNNTGTLTLDTPGSYRSLNIMNVTGNGPATYGFTLNFADGTTTTVNGNTSLDWFNGANPVFTVNGRLTRSNGSVANQNSGNPRVYATAYTLAAADQLKTLNSITFNPIGTGGYTFNVFGFSGTAGGDSQTFTNSVAVTGDSTLDQANVSNITLGPLSIGSSVLTKTGTSGATPTMSFGPTTLIGNPTFSVAAGNVLNLGAIADGSTGRTINSTGAGTLGLTAAATSAGPGTILAVLNGTVNLSAPGALGTQAAVTVNGGTLSLGANQTVGSLGGNGGIVALGTSTLSVSGGQSASYSGAVTGGSLVVSGASTNQTLAGSGSMTTTGVQNGGRLAVTAPLALGSGSVTLTGTSTLAVGVLAANSATGFGGTGTGWNLQGAINGVPPSPPTVANDVLTITAAADGGAARTAWLATPVATNRPFTATFNYSQGAGAAGADGFTFAVQNQSATAVGTPGGGLGYGGIGSSVAFAVNIFNSNTIGFAFTTNGSQPTPPYTATTPVNFGTANTTPVTVSLTYDGTNLGGTLTQGANSFTLPNVPVNLTALVGPTGFIGFTGGTGGVTATQTIDTFAFNQPDQSTYSAPLVLAANANATLSVGTTAAVPAVTMNTLTAGAGSSLTVQPAASTPTDQPYAVTFGATTLNGATTLSVQNNGAGTGTVTLGGTVAGAGSLAKQGTGTLVLATANSYAGGTTVAGGVLAVNSGTGVGTSGTGPGAVAVTGGTLGGTGRVAGLVTTSVGGTLRGDTGAGTGTLILDGGATTAGGRVAVQLTTAGGAISAASLISLSGAANFNLDATGGPVGIVIQNDAGLTFGQSYGIVLATATAASNFQRNGVPLTNGFVFPPADYQLFSSSGRSYPGSTLMVTNNTLVVTIVPVPEPAAVVAVASLGLLAVRRRRS